MIKKVCLIGLGSLGGFLAKQLAENDNIQELVLVDFDIVEKKNINKSVYSYKHIGELKVNALENIIRENNIIITKRFAKFIEGKTWIPKCDLVIDCRDFVYNRYGKIDIRVYISGKTVVTDCRKISTSKEYNGNYSISLTRNEINKASFILSQIITNDELPDLLKNEVIYKTNIDVFNDSLDKCIENNIMNKVDIIYDSNEHISRIYNLEENIYPIIEENKKHNIPVYIDDVIEKPVDIFLQGLLREPEDIFNALLPILKSYKVKNFVISLREDNNGKKFIELLEETGAA